MKLMGNFITLNRILKKITERERTIFLVVLWAILKIYENKNINSRKIKMKKEANYEKM